MSNEKVAYFKGRVGVCESLYQHDYGIVLVLDGLDLGTAFDAYFEITGEDEAVPAIGQDNRVAVPNACLAKSGKVTLHVPVHEGENDSEVEYVVTFRVIGRAKPIDDGTPAEQTAVSQAIALLKEPITNIEEIVNEALAFTGPTLAELEAEDVVLNQRVTDEVGEVDSKLTATATRLDSADTALDARINNLQAAIGSPLAAARASDMTDTTKIYVYTGTETGYTNGDWYYYDSEQLVWVDGGVYNSVAVATDKTLTVADQAADAEVVGEKVTDLKSELSNIDVNNLAEYVYLASESAVVLEDNTIISSQTSGTVVHGTNANFFTLKVDLTAVNGTFIQSELYQESLSAPHWIFTIATDTDGYLWAINASNLGTVAEVGLFVDSESITFDLTAITSTYPNAKYLYICMGKTQAVDFIITKGIKLPEWIIPDAKDLAYNNGSDDIATAANATNVQDTLEAHSGKIFDVMSVLTSDAADMRITPNLTYQNGYVHGLAYDSPHAAANTLYSNLVSAETSVINLDIASGYKALVVEYTESGEYVNMGSWLTGQTARTLTSAKYCIEIRNSENTNIDTSVASNVQVSYSKPIMPSKRKVVNITADSTEMMTIKESCDIIGNGHTIDVGENAQYALYIYGNIDVNVSNLKMVGGTTAACRVGGYALANFNQCEFKGSTGHGLSTANGSTNCTDCIATGNGTDGFNYHATGKNTAISCWGYDNGDDGISNHEQSSLKIIGGRYTGNAKAGIACPTYGAGNTDIHGAYVADNLRYGLLIFNETATAETVFVEGCLVINNPVGARISGYQVISKGTAFSGNTTTTELLNDGTITEF